MINIWNPYQCMVTFNMSRSASYFESGLGRGMGFRDSAQDLLGFVHLIPERARERILDVAATQLPDGSAYHQYQPLTKRGNDSVGTGFNDDPLWLIEGTAAYVRETGDLSILDEAVPFDNNPDDSAPLFEHLSRSFQHVLDHLGPHGLPLIGRADWNDCLNLNAFSTEPGESFQTMETQDGRTAESVFIAGLFVHAGEQYADLAAAHGLSDVAATARGHTAAMADTVMNHGWDGDWFLRAYDHFGNAVGSSKNTEGQIFIESQGMCVMAGIGAETAHADRALDSVYARLNSDHGILLHQPAFTTFHPELGEISTYPPGYKENGSVFCHTNPWVMIAATRLGRAEEAYEYWKKIAPAFREEIAGLHRTEPYVYAQMIAGRDAPRYGEAKNSWLTGTAAWNWVAITQHIIGVRPELGGLRVEPCLPAELGELSFVRHCRGAEYRVNITNDSAGGSPKLTVNGDQPRGNPRPLRRSRFGCDDRRRELGGPSRVSSLEFHVSGLLPRSSCHWPLVRVGSRGQGSAIRRRGTMTERTTAPARPRPAEEPHPSGDDRFNLIDKQLRRVQYGQDQLIETLHLAQDVFGYLDDGILIYLATGPSASSEHGLRRRHVLPPLHVRPPWRPLLHRVHRHRVFRQGSRRHRGARSQKPMRSPPGPPPKTARSRSAPLDASVPAGSPRSWSSTATFLAHQTPESALEVVGTAVASGGEA